MDPWWHLYWGACNDDVTKLEAIQQVPIYWLWRKAEERLAQADLMEAERLRRAGKI